MGTERRVEVEGRAIEPSELEWGEYRKIPVVVSAVRMNVPFRVETLEGWMKGQCGDWLIRGVEGELYPCKDSVFRATYNKEDRYRWWR